MLEEHQTQRTVEAPLSFRRIAFSRFSRGGYPLKLRKRRIVPYSNTFDAHKQHEDVLLRVRDLARGTTQSQEKDRPRYIFRSIFLRDRTLDFLHTRGIARLYPKQTPTLSINIPPEVLVRVHGVARRPKSENSRNAPLVTKNRNFSEMRY
jgi:hypothetical protein